MSSESWQSPPGAGADRITTGVTPPWMDHGGTAGDRLLLAEELLLLALDPQRGTALGTSRDTVSVALCGAFVAELALSGHATVERGRLVPIGGPPPHPLLAEVHQRLGTVRGRRSTTRLRRLDEKFDGMRSRLVDHMVAGGLLGRRRDQVLFVPVARHPVLRTDLRDAVVARARAALAVDTTVDDRTAVLLALVGAAGLVKVLAPDRGTRAHTRERLDARTKQVPIARTVQKIVEPDAWDVVQIFMDVTQS
ncbi:GPP34 family phosphoprotein [Frankia sp. R82]|uniref:GOLPH3/VPS74 family protein n=1 Tax=Frankia sp. R82 TaxID=2950553 RepID=UPI0020449319|nr:GPP34 family phosphoprotein [Frankia sp. R82]MCM3886074.1 GPP34 family phosphoprotein [Frankia sp. R82]